MESVDCVGASAGVDAGASVCAGVVCACSSENAPVYVRVWPDALTQVYMWRVRARERERVSVSGVRCVCEEKRQETRRTWRMRTAEAAPATERNVLMRMSSVWTPSSVLSKLPTPKFWCTETTDATLMLTTPRRANAVPSETSGIECAAGLDARAPITFAPTRAAIPPAQWIQPAPA